MAKDLTRSGATRFCVLWCATSSSITITRSLLFYVTSTPIGKWPRKPQWQSNVTCMKPSVTDWSFHRWCKFCVTIPQWVPVAPTSTTSTTRPTSSSQLIPPNLILMTCLVVSTETTSSTCSVCHYSATGHPKRPKCRSSWSHTWPDSLTPGLYLPIFLSSIAVCFIFQWFQGSQRARGLPRW